jgi:glycerophosphoryl diester phosphodiesterase
MPPRRSCAGRTGAGTTRSTSPSSGFAGRRRLSVALWTVDGRLDLQWVAELGVDAVITDDILTAWSELDRATAVREMVAA